MFAFVTQIEKDRDTLVIADTRADVTMQTLICSSGYSRDSQNLKSAPVKVNSKLGRQNSPKVVISSYSVLLPATWSICCYFNV